MGTRIQGVQPKEYNGRKYRSTLEAETAKALDKLGIPFTYEKRRLELIEGFRSPFQKDKVRSVTYTPDFEIGAIMLECKGFETPEWKIKKKLVFKYLSQNEPTTVFYQIGNAGKDLLEALDRHWSYLGYAIMVTSKGNKKKPSEERLFPSIEEAMACLNLQGKPKGRIASCMLGKTRWVYNYNWKLKKIKL